MNLFLKVSSKSPYSVRDPPPFQGDGGHQEEPVHQPEREDPVEAEEAANIFIVIEEKSFGQPRGQPARCTVVQDQSMKHCTAKHCSAQRNVMHCATQFNCSALHCTL